MMKSLVTLSLALYVNMASAAPEALRMVYSNTSQPLSWLDNGVPRGMLVDLVEEVVSNRLHIPVEHILVPWVRAQAMVNERNADGFVTIATKKRQAYMNVSSEPAVDQMRVLIARADHPRLAELKQIRTLEALAPYRVGVHRGNGWAKLHLEPLMELVKTASISQLISMLAAKRIDMVFHGEHVLQFHKNELGYADELVVLPNPLASAKFRFMVRKDSPYGQLPAQFNLELQKMHDDGSYEEILDRYRRPLTGSN